MKRYIEPEVRHIELDLGSFLCASIGQMVDYVEVDEYGNTGEETLTFDSDY